jgi:hypothetical protein
MTQVSSIGAMGKWRIGTKQSHDNNSIAAAFDRMNTTVAAGARLTAAAAFLAQVASKTRRSLGAVC